MAYDSNRHKMVLFGGQGGDLLDQNLSDTLEWDGATGVWSDVSPSPGLGGHAGHCIVFDDRSNRVLVFGGYRQAIQFASWDAAVRGFRQAVPIRIPKGATRPR